MAAGDSNQQRKGEAHTQLRAYLEYFRDLGVYEFYRNGEPCQAADEPEYLAAPVAPVDHGSVRVLEERISPDSAPLAAAERNLPATEPEIAKPVSLNDRAPLPSVSVPSAQHAQALQQIVVDIGDCTRCPLAYGGRRKIVFGDGDSNARLMFVGEGPGADEDEHGIPFVGKSGQLLNNMITAMGLSREQVYIANIVKCRPPANRAPEPIEANTCTQFLARQMDVVRPEFVVALGATAATYLLGVKQSLASLRGQWHMVRGARTIVTYHPAFLLRDPRQKGEAWKDLQLVMAAMGLKGRG